MTGPGRRREEVTEDAIGAFAAHAAGARLADLPPAAVAAAKTFILDTLGVAIAGSGDPYAARLADTVATWGAGEEATVLGTGRRLPAQGAAFVNAFQIHGLEFDCVHEGAVVHPLAAILPSLLGWAEREGGISGDGLLRAVIAAVDVAVTLGLCSRAPMRFFRPANCGGFGAVAGLALLAGLDEMQTRNALGTYYGQCAGTMQAHVEATPQLAMQMGFAARSALTAIELARRGMPGPRAPISGQFGYFALFDGEADPVPFDTLGQSWRICELSHKPWPSGRATHGSIDGLQRLTAEHGISAEQVKTGRFLVPPLTFRLVGRPPLDGMTVAYARLCLPYVGALCLGHGTVGLGDFTPGALDDPETLALARRLSVIADDNPNPNALHPVRVELDLADGSTIARDITEILGSPARPLSPEAARAKFDACCGALADNGAALWGSAMVLDQWPDIRLLLTGCAP